MAANQEKLQQLLAKLPHKELYVCITEPVHSPAIREKLYDHLLEQIERERQGVMFGAGPLQDEDKGEPTRGMWIIRASSFAEARAIVDQDIFHRSGLRTYKLYKWTMNEGSMTFTIRYSDQSVKIV
jgi:uncharacterized protein YciI